MHNYLSNSLFFISLLAGGAVGAAFAGRLFTEKLRPVFRFKPFNCRPCLTFHLTWAFMGAIALWFDTHSPSPIDRHNAVYIALCITLSALLNYCIAKQNCKITP